jgi:hypothetical protein
MTCYIIRFRGRITQGPNAGRSFDWADSWAGILFSSEDSARAKLADWRRLEPGCTLRLVRRDWVGHPRTGRFEETIIEEFPPTTMGNRPPAPEPTGN